MTDTYTIKFASDGEASGKTSITVAPTAIDNSTLIPIHGKYSTPFGEDLWTSIVHVMENFCSATGPSPNKVTMGQLWFDSATQTLKVWKVLSVSPYTIGWAPVNSFDSSGTLAVDLKTSLPNNGIVDDTAAYDNYFVTRGYTNDHYLPKGNYVSGTTALSKAKIKYSTDVTFDTGDTTALVTKKYVDDKIGVVGQLSFTVAPNGDMTANKALIGQVNNLILDSTTAYDNYFITRDYADHRYLRLGTFVNSDHEQSIAKIQYSADVVYSSNTDDDYTLVHKKYVADAITAATGSAVTAPASGLVISDGTDLSSVSYVAGDAGKLLSVDQTGGLIWTKTLPDIPTWVTGTLSKGVLVSDGGNITSSIGTNDSVLTTNGTGDLAWIAKSTLGGGSGGPTLPSTKGVMYIDSAGLPTVVGGEGNDTVLSISSSGVYEWIAKASLGGSTNTTPTPSTQKWRDETQNRYTSTMYTNRTGYPIMISVDDSNVANVGLVLSCDGKVIAQSAISAPNCNALITDIIPAGSTYMVAMYGNNISTIRPKWRELTLDWGGGGSGTPLTTTTNVTAAFWTDMRSQRKGGVTYTNNSTEAIFVILAIGNTPNKNYNVYVGTTVVGITSTVAMENITFIVPAGSTYRYDCTNVSSTNGEIYAWVESGAVSVNGGTGTSTGSGSGKVSMVRNTTTNIALASHGTLKNLVSLTIPASPAGTTVEYWVTYGSSDTTIYPAQLLPATSDSDPISSLPEGGVCNYRFTLKQDSTILTQTRYIADSNTPSYSGAISVSVSSTPIVLTLSFTGLSINTTKSKCNNNYITATPITPL